MDGLELIDRLKRDYPLIQVILLTAHSEFQFAQRALKLGAVDYLVKTFLEEEVIGEAISKARAGLLKERSLQQNAREQRRWQQSERLNEIMKADTNPLAAFHSLFQSIERFVKLFVYADLTDLSFIDRTLQKNIR